MRLISILIVLLLPVTAVSAQKKCLSANRAQQLLREHPELHIRKQAIELENQRWMATNNAAKQKVVYNIPVVVHIVHSGEAISTNGPNVSDNQVYDQIRVLNEDYRKLNPDALPNGHPFAGLAADAEIAFCLAQRDPSGNSTDGIVRINGLERFGESDWTADDIDFILKPETQWNARQYLNIWVVKITDFGPDAGTLGYAFGSDQHGSSLDGVVIDHRYFGTLGNLTPGLDQGRTTTHEVGHYFNLEHTWGDDLCGDDKVFDTPPQAQATFGCPAFPNNANNSCGSDANGEMFMNFMDYTDDDCMALFTLGQKQRMHAAIVNQRSSLLSSPGCQWPVGIRTSQSAGFKVYPNPADDKLVVELPPEPEFTGTLSLLDIYGRSVLTLSATQAQHIIDVSTLPAGLYLLVYNNSVQKLHIQ